MITWLSCRKLWYYLVWWDNFVNTFVIMKLWKQSCEREHHRVLKLMVSTDETFLITQHGAINPDPTRIPGSATRGYRFSNLKEGRDIYFAYRSFLSPPPYISTFPPAYLDTAGGAKFTQKIIFNVFSSGH